MLAGYALSRARGLSEEDEHDDAEEEDHDDEEHDHEEDEDEHHDEEEHDDEEHGGWMRACVTLSTATHVTTTLRAPGLTHPERA